MGLLLHCLDHSPNIHCDFENGDCGYTDITVGINHWLLTEDHDHGQGLIVRYYHSWCC